LTAQEPSLARRRDEHLGGLYKDGKVVVREHLVESIEHFMTP
jgi:hypothetical protein